MADPKKTTASAVAIVAAMALGAGAQRLAAPPLPTSAKFTSLEVLNDKLPRYAINIATTAGANGGSRQVVCETDGSAPKINGRPTTEAGLIAACKAMPVFYSKVQNGVAAASDELNRAIAPEQP